jgi:hypothetical protein
MNSFLYLSDVAEHEATFNCADKGLQMPRIKVIHLNQKINHKNRFAAWI